METCACCEGLRRGVARVGTESELPHIAYPSRSLSLSLVPVDPASFASSAAAAECASLCPIHPTPRSSQGRVWYTQEGKRCLHAPLLQSCDAYMRPCCSRVMAWQSPSMST
eukprot:101406-Chlamydomonas_euryale.AAC.11